MILGIVSDVCKPMAEAMAEKGKYQATASFFGHCAPRSPLSQTSPLPLSLYSTATKMQRSLQFLCRRSPPNPLVWIYLPNARSLNWSLKLSPCFCHVKCSECSSFYFNGHPPLPLSPQHSPLALSPNFISLTPPYRFHPKLAPWPSPLTLGHLEFSERASFLC